MVHFFILSALLSLSFHFISASPAGAGGFPSSLKQCFSSLCCFTEDRVTYKSAYNDGSHEEGEIEGGDRRYKRTYRNGDYEEGIVTHGITEYIRQNPINVNIQPVHGRRNVNIHGAQNHGIETYSTVGEDGVPRHGSKMIGSYAKVTQFSNGLSELALYVPGPPGRPDMCQIRYVLKDSKGNRVEEGVEFADGKRKVLVPFSKPRAVTPIEENYGEELRDISSFELPATPLQPAHTPAQSQAASSPSFEPHEAIEVTPISENEHKYSDYEGDPEKIMNWTPLALDQSMLTNDDKNDAYNSEDEFEVVWPENKSLFFSSHS